MVKEGASFFRRASIHRDDKRAYKQRPQGAGRLSAMRCSVCANPQVETVDNLLGTGSSVRKVARITGIPRTTLARHREHSKVGDRKLALIRNQGGPDGPTGPVDPLSEALALARRARTDRERLKAAEAIRSAVALQVKALAGDVDAEVLERLDRNIDEAARLYQQVEGFENVTRALADVREAIRQRLEAVRVPGRIDVPVVLGQADGTPVGETHWHVTEEQFLKGVPKQYRDPNRFAVHRTIQLGLDTEPTETIKIYDAGTEALLWASDPPGKDE